MGMIWFDIGAILVGLAHAIAAWLYFSRERHGWIWSASWLAATAACIAAAQANPALGYGLFLALVAMWTLWWVSIKPATVRNWVAENRHQATGHIAGDMLTVEYVRAFDWTSKREFTEHWQTRSYDLAKLDAIDLFVCTWGDARIAHTILSFAFRDVPPLAMTIETRREEGERWTPLAGFMRAYEIIFIAIDERDAIRNRAVVRDEDVRLYRLVSTPGMRRALLERYIATMNRLARRPRFYNTLSNNCTTEIGRLVRAAGHPYPFDWRILVSGYVAEFLYGQKLLDTSISYAELRERAGIRDKARAAAADPAFSARIRDGLPDPNRLPPGAGDEAARVAAG